MISVLVKRSTSPEARVQPKNLKMTSQLGFLSLSLLLITLLNAQPMQARPQYHSHGEHSPSREIWANSQPPRPPTLYYHGHAHEYGPGQGEGHGHGHGHGHGWHREHGHHHNQYAGQYERNNPARPHYDPEPRYPGQHGAGIGQTRPGYSGVDNGVRPSYRPNEHDEENEQGAQPLQPRPQTEQHGHRADPLVPRPGLATDNDEVGSSIQPRPQQGNQGQFGLEQWQAGNSGSAATLLQPRPSKTPFVFQEPDNGGFSEPIQPRPTNTQLIFQTTDDRVNPKPIQPRPGQANAGLAQHEEQSAGHTFQPRPSPASDSESSVDDNIASIFNTQNFLSPTLNEDSPRDPKSQPESVGERNLFNTGPMCPEGSEMQGGHCRRKA